MSKEMRQRLVDPTPEAVAANRARYRRRWIELTIVVLLVLPAQMLASSGAPLWAPIPAVIGWGAVAIGGGYLLWRLHRFETEGRARWRQRLHAEGDANVAAVLRSSDIPGR